MQLVAYGSLLAVVLVGLVLPNVFIPFVLTGLLDASVPSMTVLTLWTTLVLALALAIVIFNLIRFRRRATALLGGAAIIAFLVYFFVSSAILGGDSAYSLRSLQLRVGNLALIATSVAVWRIAMTTTNPGVHMLHYLVSAVMLSSTSCRLVDVAESTRPLQTLLAPLRADAQSEWQSPAAFCLDAVDMIWWFFGLSYDRLRVALSVMNIGVVALRYALSDRAYHLPSSPLRMALILQGVVTSIVELVPVGPILALRVIGHLILGRAFLDTLHHCGMVGLCLRPGRFCASVSLRARCDRARSLAEWREVRAALDAREGRERWRQARSAHYDHRLVDRALDTLRRVRREADETGSPHALAELLMSLVNRKFANINDPHNYLYPGVGTKAAIEALLEETAAAIRHLVRTNWRDSSWGAVRMSAFVAAARHAHGCTALCLSGGGAIAMYHLGLVRELLEEGLLPSVISGTSGGAIVAGLLACRTNEELPDFIVDDVSTRDGHRWFDDTWTMLQRFATEGVVVDKERFLQALHPICGDLTFAEAFARTGRLVNLSTSTTSLGSTLLLNHIITPNVLVRSAVQASCALPGVMKPDRLLAKRPDGRIVTFESAGLLFRDGSFQSDIPMRELSAQFHCTHFVVSQVNAHVAPFLFDPSQPCSLLFRLQRFIVTDVRARLDKYAKASYLPKELQSLVQQEYAGKAEDVTVVPRLRLSDLTWRILSHPTVPDMSGFIGLGARMTWPHLRRIHYQTLVERALQQGALDLGVQVYTPRLNWNEGHARGPAVDSDDDDDMVLPPAVTGGGSGAKGDVRQGGCDTAPARRGRMLLPQMSWPTSPTIARFGASLGELVPDMSFCHPPSLSLSNGSIPRSTCETDRLSNPLGTTPTSCALTSSGAQGGRDSGLQRQGPGPDDREKNTVGATHRRGRHAQGGRLSPPPPKTKGRDGGSKRKDD